MTEKKLTSQNTQKGLSEDLKTLITILLLLFAYPIGLILMFIWMKWPKWVKILICIIPLILIIFWLFIFLVVLFPALKRNRSFMQEQQLCLEKCGNPIIDENGMTITDPECSSNCYNEQKSYQLD